MATQKDPGIGEVWMELTERKRLAKLLVIQDISQRRLAEDIGWKSHTYVARLLKGEAKTLTPEAAIKIAIRLGVGVDDLFVAKTSSDIEAIRQYRSRKPAA